MTKLIGRQIAAAFIFSERKHSCCSEPLLEFTFQLKVDENLFYFIRKAIAALAVDKSAKETRAQ